MNSSMALLTFNY